MRNAGAEDEDPWLGEDEIRCFDNRIRGHEADGPLLPDGEEAEI